MVCRLSIVVPGSDHSGAILDLSSVPVVGDRIVLGEATVEVLEVMELIPPRGEFHFVHATCRLVEPPTPPAPTAPPAA